MSAPGWPDRQPHKRGRQTMASDGQPLADAPALHSSRSWGSLPGTSGPGGRSWSVPHPLPMTVVDGTLE